MITILMGVAIFSVGFFMLIVAVLDLLGISPRNFGIGERILVYGGGVLLCVVGYFMASRRPRPLTPPEDVMPQPGFQQPPGMPGTPGMPPATAGQAPPGFEQGPPPESF